MKASLLWILKTRLAKTIKTIPVGNHSALVER